ncbi:MAG TPA: DNA-3-methyladenine glycosylase I [Flavobacteriaceae bacterium]|nr:DNA-3-methyladenine glycosylase I [Flavobacteriaceae bacterium]MCB9214126.1 DNA-3-methyladenine glycosylase I [Alteromonas sp.]HPF11533.1 DNA-3-methyladenine glycosylase I [Flavobacteriaceae bacterium]HQU21066.1 DNA-3-methyladenine glycosylase I [Flavobacteriaceae bacterium]HQU65218.1 DNA-3-methyladenine glycosylase I [Flavobacteriaceae bacterium]
MKIRCGWCGDDSLYVSYHDEEWGVPVKDDALLFEFLTLETFQAGLSWITVLRKRENFRRAFDQFDYHKIARYSEAKITSLLNDPGIIRNQLKVRAAVTNAQVYLEVQQEFGSFSNYIWGFVDGTPIHNTWKSLKEVPASTPLSDAISKDLKKRGFKFVGSTVVYAHMQATGMVNDHIVECFRHKEV